MQQQKLYGNNDKVVVLYLKFEIKQFGKVSQQLDSCCCAKIVLEIIL